MFYQKLAYYNRSYYQSLQYTVKDVYSDETRYEAKTLLNCRHINKASKANLDAYKRIIKWQPFLE